MWPFKILLIGISFLFLANCNLPSTQKRDDAKGSSSSFYIEKLSGKYVSEAFRKDISLPKERTYTFNACLKDLKKSKPVIHHPFIIEEINQEIKTDASGCLNWNENFSLEYLTEPAFIKVERKITSKGLHTGTEVISFAINLWDIDTYKEIVDLSKASISPLVEGSEAEAKIKGTQQKNKFDLWVEDGRLFVTDDKLGESFQLKYEFSLQPYIKLKKTSGEATAYNLKYGLFKGKLEVIQRFFDGKNQNNSYDILSSVTFDKAVMEKGVLSFGKTLSFSSPPTRGNLYLRMTLEPENEIANLNTFSGIYPLGEARNLRNNQFLKVSTSPDLIKEVQSKLPTIEANNKNQESNTNNDNETKADKLITIAPLSFKAISGEQVLYHNKIVRYNVTACFSNNLVSSPLVFQKFKVYGFSQDETKPGELKELNRKSNHLGCIYWTDSFEFNMYDCQQFYRGYVIIENPHFNLKEKVYYYINPWVAYSFGTFDEKEIENVNVLNTSCNKKNPKKSEIVLDSVTFENTGQENENRINAKLEMEIKRSFSVTLHPKVSIPSDVTHDYNASPESLANGFYLLRVAIFRNFNTAGKTELIAHKDIPVLNKNHIIYGKFNFFVKDKRLLETRNTVLLQLIPVKQDQFVSENDYTIKQKNESLNIEETIDKETTLLSPIYKQEITLDSNGTHNNLTTFSGSEIIRHLKVEYKDSNKDFNLSQFINDFKAKSLEDQKKLQAMVITPEDLSASNNLTFIKNVTAQTLSFWPSINQSVENKKVSFDEKVAQQLCDYWFKNLWLDKFNLGERILKIACNKASKNNIKSFFDFDHVFIVKNVAGSQYMGPGSEKSITTAASFSLSNSYSNNHSITMASLAGKIGLSPFKNNFASVGAEVATSISTGASSAQSEANATSLAESSTLQVTESQFKITTSNYQYCLAIKPNPSLFYNSGKNLILKLWDGDFDYSYFFKSNLSDQEKMKVANAGILVCPEAPAEVKNKPISFIEQYYWIQQNLSNNEVQDARDERTRVFSIMLRGHQDYTRFKLFLTNKWTTPAGSSLNKTDSERIFNNFLYFNSFKTTNPGVYIFKDQNNSQ